jgi:hypothetical protein
MSSREQRIAHNETVFRDANEDIRERFDEMGLRKRQEAVFVCECGNTRCQQLVRVTLAEYEAVRADANTFLIVPGHDDSATEQVVTSEVVEPNDRLAVVRKRKEMRAVTEASDPRDGGDRS